MRAEPILVALVSLIVASPAVGAPTAAAQGQGSGAVAPPPHVSQRVPQEGRAGRAGSLRGNRNYTSTISGMRLISPYTQILALSYDGSCYDRALGTWGGVPVLELDYEAAQDTIITEQCDLGNGKNCDEYACTPSDQLIWSTYAAAEEFPHPTATLEGARSLWCGKLVTDVLGQQRLGYSESNTPQLLYVDTGTHAAAYTLTFLMKFSCALDDTIYLIGGGGGVLDPIQGNWALLSEVLRQGEAQGVRQLVRWTGSFGQPVAPVNLSGAQSPIDRIGQGEASDPTTQMMTIQGIPAEHRALYLVFLSGGEEGTQSVWQSGEGQILDRIEVSDNGPRYVDGGGSGLPCADALGVAFDCDGTTVRVAGRVPTSADCFSVESGSTLVNEDPCSTDKSVPADSSFALTDALMQPDLSASFTQCTFPVPVGTGALVARWSHYLDLPQGSGYVQVAEYRFFQAGMWSAWRNTNPSGAVRTGNERAWTRETDELTEAVLADSVQMRFSIRCVPSLTPGGVSCPPIPVGLYYDNLGLFAFTGGPPTPSFGVFPGALAQTTFVDGTMSGLNCTTLPCWPGIRGTEVGPGAGIDDNVNSAVGDSLVFFIRSPLRRNGMGINWRHGFDKLAGGSTPSILNASYNPAFDPPRVIYRLFDPATKSWGPFDSTGLDADDVRISATDTALVESAFRMDWPPRDKAGFSLPPGFTVNGVSAYNNLRYLPRGTRLQYYLKAVDVNGATAYQFQGDGAAWEVADLPTLPGGTAKAPDILEFAVLPGVYAPGSPGSLLAGRTTTPVLNLDGSYTAFSFAQDPVTQALRGMGVRADRYRHLLSVGYGNNVGGHELTGAPDNQRPRRATNFFPNMTEYAILDSLANWYRIVIQSGHLRSGLVEDEADARLLEEWWRGSTGTHGGDRCLFVSGDDYVASLLTPPAGEASPRRASYAQNVLGITGVGGEWNGIPYPSLDDRFANPASGPGLLPGYAYPVDCGCPGPNRFDPLIKAGSPEAQNVAFYPPVGGITDVAAVAMQAERDPIGDHDRSKSLSYGFSFQFIRKAGVPTSASNYAHSGVQERMQVLYKFLAGCRAARSGPADTAKCWPCPTDADMTGNWAALPGFQTGTYGSLYPIQDHLTVSGADPDALGSPRFTNRLDQNRPNPFNPATTIPYVLASPGRVRIRIFDVGGRLVQELDQGHRPAGQHLARWDGRLRSGQQAASGVYFYRIEYPAGGASARKMILLR